MKGAICSCFWTLCPFLYSGFESIHTPSPHLRHSLDQVDKILLRQVFRNVWEFKVCTLVMWSQWKPHLNVQLFLYWIIFSIITSIQTQHDLPLVNTSLPGTCAGIIHFFPYQDAYTTVGSIRPLQPSSLNLTILMFKNHVSSPIKINVRTDKVHLNVMWAFHGMGS